MSHEGPDVGDGIRARRFEDMFAATYPRVLSYALRRAADRDQAEEAVSETFLVAWRRSSDVPAEPLPWLLGTARKVLANQRRSSRRRLPDGPHVPLGDAGHPSASETPIAELVAERHAFASAFAALGARDREALSLIAWDGLEVREAAQALGCTSAAFSVRLHRARRRLLKELKASGHSLGESNRPSLRQRLGTTEAR